MRSMKTLLRLLGAVSLTTVAASSVVACGSKAPEIHVDVAKLLDWYDAQGKSKINQKLNKDDTVGQEKYSIIADDSLIKLPELFKTKLLIQGSATDKFKAKNTEATKLLSDLGFKSGSESKDYSTDDVTKITALIAKVTSSTPGKIKENTQKIDFNVENGTCQVDIMDKAGDGAKVVKSYTIKTLKNDILKVQFEVSSIVKTANLDFIKDKGYVQGGTVLTTLPWKSDKSAEKKLYDSLVNLIGSQKLVWSTNAAGTEIINTYPASGKAYLTVRFGDVKVSSHLDCGILPPA